METIILNDELVFSAKPGRFDLCAHIFKREGWPVEAQKIKEIHNNFSQKTKIAYQEHFLKELPELTTDKVNEIIRFLLDHKNYYVDYEIKEFLQDSREQGKKVILKTYLIDATNFISNFKLSSYIDKVITKNSELKSETILL